MSHTRLPAGAVVPIRHPDAPAPGQALPSHYDNCVGCGNAHPTGLHLKLIAGDGLSATGVFTVTTDHQGAPGLAHGGILALAFDDVLGALAWLVRTPCVTGKLETDFFMPVPVGSRLFITATLDGQLGRRLFMSAKGRLDESEGPVAVRAQATFVVVDVAHFRNHAAPDVLAQAIKDGKVRAASGRPITAADGVSPDAEHTASTDSSEFEVNP